MKNFVVGVGALAALLSLAGCGGCGDATAIETPKVGAKCAADSECAPLVCIDGACAAKPSVDAGDPGVCDPDRTDNSSRDTDCDGVSDQAEYLAVHPSGSKTDPCNADTDGDGLSDGLEQGRTASPSASCTSFTGDADPASKTDPTVADSDGDGAADGVEDENKNGAKEANEPSPLRVDSDCDGLRDGFEIDAGCAIDPTLRDSDLDGISDGVEGGASPPGPDPSCTYDLGTFDVDPSTRTSACNADSDGDGIPDGTEDSNKNGQVDPTEPDPSDAGDGSGPVGEACSASKLRPVVFRQAAEPDLQISLSTGFASDGGQVGLIVQGGKALGLMGFDPTRNVTFLLYSQPTDAGAPGDDELAVRTGVESLGPILASTVQSFTTWDGLLASQAFYDQAPDSGVDLIAQTNRIADRLVGADAGVLVGSASGAGPFKLQVEVVHRTAQRRVVLAALTPIANFVEPAIFTMGDTAGGSALASFPDATGVQCERFTPANANVDFLFSVDDSASMPQEQQALADAANALANALNNSTLNWRIALVTTSYLAAPLAGSNRSVVRGFTRDINQFKAWMTQGSVCDAGFCTGVSPAAACDSNGPLQADGRWGGCWIGAGGTGNVAAEAILGAARKAVNDLAPATATEQTDKFRAGAHAVVILLGDADDLSTGYTTSATACVSNDAGCEDIQHFIDFFRGQGDGGTTRNPLGQVIPVHGIICPDGVSCGETVEDPRRTVQVIVATGGVMADITKTPTIPAAVATAVQSVIGSAGHRLARAPIGASMKVAVDAVEDSQVCSALNDLPRSRQDGFDFDGVNGTLNFYGACRPPPSSSTAAVSYRYWLKGSEAGACDCTSSQTCDVEAQECVCLPDCGGTCASGTQCDMPTCQCVAIIE